MAKLVLSTNAKFPLFFDVSHAVGANGQNAAEDVALVTFLMRSAAPAVQNPKARALHESVQVTNRCTPQLISQIQELEQMIGAPRDGRVSVASASGTFSGGQIFMICKFNFMTRQANPNQWPRLDYMTVVPCPPEVRALIQRTIVGQ